MGPEGHHPAESPTINARLAICFSPSLGRPGEPFDRTPASPRSRHWRRHRNDAQPLHPKAPRWSATNSKRGVFRWLGFYNHRRRHTTIGYLAPVVFEQRSTTLAIAA
ncbi:hypothetical protein OHB25_03445 [Streptomyces mirabilis]|uniref:hypothetical protein n=1 Tax=Streptomyces mirabilis TaxID=68239 RepID=UPI002259A9E3|nr:hypothetical protein [Streptomyces mirabilis]MCX4617328.1 hypothetical protein [Streptomyces mirabilis]MCX5356332.1 hypothetical protein [Streptomyces mirabilis]